MEKSTIRKIYIDTLKKMTQEDYIEKSNLINEQLFELKEFKHASMIAITMSRLTEVETRSIIEWCWSIGKSVAVPKTNSKEKTMEFRKITSFNQMEIVYLDIEEPVLSLTERVHPTEIELIIVPGVVFSHTGYRIGYGGGYYDRFLQDYSGVTVSLAFEVQVLERVPKERHDLGVQKIITEERVIECNKMV